ncbi:MAG: HAD-IIA family hydrolase [Chloroflexi bacterium]|nr:MAG: HAD-IIA family hydrolase [Chloroflexota bacterium]
MARALSSYAAYLFDVDGTLVHHHHAIPGAAEALQALKAAGKDVRAVTNNSSLGQHALAERFRRFGLPLEDHEVFSALVATARHVAQEQPGACVHVFGNPGLRSECERFGLRVTDAVDADYVVVGNHRGITYEKLTIAMRALLRGARFVTVNMDRTYVGADGDLVPGCGVFAAALERAVGRPPDVIVGKPSITLLCEAADSVGQPADQCLYVGDNPEADVGGAHAAGMHALLVLTGVASSADESVDDPPEHVLPSVADLAPFVRDQVYRDI